MSVPLMRVLDGASHGQFEVVEELFEHRIVCRYDHRREGDPFAEFAFEVEGVVDKGSGTTRDGLKYVPAIDIAPVNGLEGELDQSPGNVCGAGVSDISMTATGSVIQRSIQDHRTPVGSRPQCVFR